MPGWSSRLFPNSTSSQARRNPSPDFDEEIGYLPRPPFAQDIPGPSRGHGYYGSSPPKGPGGSPRSRPHKHTGSEMMLGAGKKPSAGAVRFESSSYPSTSDTLLQQRGLSIPKPGKGKVEERDMDTGNCATCDARVKWPRGVNEFRCGTCLMVNDLKIAQPRSRSPREPSTKATGSTTGNPGPVPHHRVLPITVERTMAMIDRCIDTYLDAFRNGRVPHRGEVVGTPPASPEVLPMSPGKISPASPSSGALAGLYDRDLPTTPPDDSPFLQPFTFEHESSSGKANPAFTNRRPSRGIDSSIVQREGAPIVRKPVEPTSIPSRAARKPPPAPVNTASRSGTTNVLPTTTRPPAGDGQKLPNQEHETGKTIPMLPPTRIFKPVEEYVVRCYGDQDCLTTSFLSTRPRPRVASRGDETLQPRTDRSPTKAAAKLPESALPDIDPRMLMLGDVASNGQWWTGVHERSTAPGQRRKSDRVPDGGRSLVTTKNPNIQWFELDNWYDTILRAGTNWRDRARDNDKQQKNAEQIDHDLGEARAHLHNILLKCMETLLKRPGRPLKEPQDIRFLLVLLANPLIQPPSRSMASKPNFNAASNTWENGNAFGIIKRILGLLANVSHECHRHLTAWFARYEEPRFRVVVDLIERFVTHRLRRLRGRRKSQHINPTAGLIPSLSGTGADTSASLHAALGLSNQSKSTANKADRQTPYSEDWQVKAAAKVMSVLFMANKVFSGERMASTMAEDARMSRPGSMSRTHIKIRGQLLSTSDFYNSMVDMSDLIADFDIWESSKGAKFAFCQYPFFLSVAAKIRIMEHDAKRQMDVIAREAFFDSLLKNRALEQYLTLKVRRDCLVEDSLTSISEVVGTGSENIKKSLKVQFVNEEGVDAGGLRKEWFLLLAREIFDPNFGLFLYDEESRFCWFNSNSFESSDRFFLVGALLGLAIYHTTIVDVPLPSFTFKKLLHSTPLPTKVKIPIHRPPLQYTLDDLAEIRPSLARGLKQLLEFDGNVQETFCRDFVVEVSAYGSTTQVPLCENGSRRSVTNENRSEFVDLYVRYILDVQISRQFEPFKRGFFTVCGGNALSLFQPEEIELLVRGSDEAMDVASLRAVAVYQNWKVDNKVVSDPARDIALVRWFWELLEEADPKDQRKLLSFMTGSDRIPAVGATSLIITLQYAGPDFTRYPTARTCFNMLLLYSYRSKEQLKDKLWSAMNLSEGFGLK